MRSRSVLTAVAFTAALGCVAAEANAQVKDDWRFRAIIYGYFPDIGGSTAFPTNSSAATKGRVNFGANREWFVPYYVDVGTGGTDLTWQAIGGIGYAFQWGQIIAAWSYLDYKFKSCSAIESLSFNGPAIGVAFNW